MSKEQIKECLYEDMKGDAMIIINLITNAYNISNKNGDMLQYFYPIEGEELKERYFKNIDWKAVVDIAVSAMSRQETYNYLSKTTN